MKTKFIKRILSLIICLMLLLSFTGCVTTYHSKAGDASEIWGTYKLTTYEKKDENDVNYDALTSEGITAYMVINNDKYGYYVYKDNQTDLWYDSFYLNYIYDEDGEDPTLVKAIEVKLGCQTVYLWSKKPGCGDEPIMGFDVENHTLSYTILKDTLTIYNPPKQINYQYVMYTKISDDTDLTKVREELSLDLPDLVHYTLKNLGSYQYLSSTGTSNIEGKENPNFNDENTAYKYKYVVADFTTLSDNEFTVHYATTDQPDTDLTVKGLFELDTSGDTGIAYLTILGQKYLVPLDTYGIPGSFFSRSVWTDEVDGTSSLLYSELFSKYSGDITDETTVDDIIAYAKTKEIFEAFN